MKYFLLPVLSFLFIMSANATDKDSVVYYNLHDSVKAVQFMAEINIPSFDQKKFLAAGIKKDVVEVALVNYRNSKKYIRLTFPERSPIMARGLNTFLDPKSSLEFKYDWQVNKPYKLVIAVASDSAGNFSLYSGYVWLPEQEKWKLIGTCKISDRWNTITKPATFTWQIKKKIVPANVGQVWIQRSNGSWKNMKDEDLPPPTIILFGHLDSVQQHQTEIKLIEEALASGKIETRNIERGVYYYKMRNGLGKQVSINDTVTVNYRLILLNDTTVVGETKDKPATFPLKGLIRGWQIGVPLCRVGGKIKLVIPSDLAYSIRTRSAKIPPNSILVFEIEVLDAKTP